MVPFSARGHAPSLLEILPYRRLDIQGTDGSLRLCAIAALSPCHRCDPGEMTEQRGHAGTCPSRCFASVATVAAVLLQSRRWRPARVGEWSSISSRRNNCWRIPVGLRLSIIIPQGPLPHIPCFVRLFKFYDVQGLADIARAEWTRVQLRPSMFLLWYNFRQCRITALIPIKQMASPSRGGSIENEQHATTPAFTAGWLAGKRSCRGKCPWRWCGS